MESRGWFSIDLEKKLRARHIGPDNGQESTINEIGTSVTESTSNNVPEKLNDLYKKLYCWWRGDCNDGYMESYGRLQDLILHVIERLVQFTAISILYLFEKVKNYKCYYLVWFIDALRCIFNILYELGLRSACMIRFCFTYNLVWRCLYLTILCSFLCSFIYPGRQVKFPLSRLRKTIWILIII